MRITAGFASKLDEALCLNRDNNKMGMAAYKRAQNFSLEKVSRDFMQAVEDVL